MLVLLIQCSTSRDISKHVPGPCPRANAAVKKNTKTSIAVFGTLERVAQAKVRVVANMKTIMAGYVANNSDTLPKGSISQNAGMVSRKFSPPMPQLSKPVVIALCEFGEIESKKLLL